MVPTALTDAVCVFVARAPTELVEAVAARIRTRGPNDPVADVRALMTSPAGRAALSGVLAAWSDSEVTGAELYGLLIGSARATRASEDAERIELVWTGPTTRFVPLRRSDRVLLELIQAAEIDVLIVSFVAYDVPEIISALKDALARGVKIRMLLESATYDASLSHDPIAIMRALVPGAALLVWSRREGDFEDGRVHAKFAIVDGIVAFVSSANLTGNAYSKNMEAGIVVRGGPVPERLRDHMRALIDEGVVTAA